MVWGVTDSNGKSVKTKEELLSPLGLSCWGGWDHDKIYHITNKDESFDIHLSEKEINNIESIYIRWLRKKKLDKINEQKR